MSKCVFVICSGLKIVIPVEDDESQNNAIGQTSRAMESSQRIVHIGEPPIYTFRVEDISSVYKGEF